MQRPEVIRIGLVALGALQALIGLWALVDTHGWFTTFPGAGHHWLPAYGAYNAHLAIDVGATFTAIGVLMLLAAVWMERRLVQAALITYLVYAIPHLIYHLGADDALATGDQVASDVSLALAVIAPLVLLWLTRRPASGGARAPEQTGP